MCKQIKRLLLLSECPHLNKTDRDAITFLLRETGNIKVEPEKGFDGFDFSSWPEMPDKNLFKDWIKTRKSKGKAIITQTFINHCSEHLLFLAKKDISVNRAISFAANDGWQGFQSNWVLKEIEKNKTPEKEYEGKHPKSEQDYIDLIMTGKITHISQIKNYKHVMTSNYIKGYYKPDVMQALETIGFTA